MKTPSYGEETFLKSGPLCCRYILSRKAGVGPVAQWKEQGESGYGYKEKESQAGQAQTKTRTR